MCGINGLIYKNKIPEIDEILRMNKSIKHRGPDDQGCFKFENVVLGHVRLSILDLSSRGKQPMSNDNRFWIIYNGEIYNFKKIKKELCDLGHKFYSETDTEVILNAYKQWGFESFHKFNGMWSFAILDTHKKELIISRDRYGVKPCYYYADEEKFIFSSEIKGIYSSNIKLELDKNKFLRNAKILEGAFTTIFKSVHVVPPGSYFILDLKNLKIKKKRWWHTLDNFPLINVNASSIKESLKELLIEATQQRLIADVKIATSLSGGVDSSIIFSILNNIDKKYSNLDLNPFILKYKQNQTFDDAIKLSNYFKRKPCVIESKDKYTENITKKLSSIEIAEPYFNQLEIYKAQKEKGFKVSIDGHGADESLGGYDQDIQFFGMYFQNSIVELYNALRNTKGADSLKRIVKKHNFVEELNRYDLNIFKLFFTHKKVHNNYVKTDDIDLVSPYLEKDIKKLQDYNFPLQVMFIRATYGSLQWLLNKWDKASMASSVEIRSPFMDWNFFQYALALPAELKIKYGQNKSILRDAFKNTLPNKLKLIKQGLPLVNNISDKKNNDLVENVLTQKKFKESKIWESKKIIKDFNDSESKTEKMPLISKIVHTHLLVEGYDNRKLDSSTPTHETKESYNKLV